ncbi:MAG: rhodanese-like domain-containing protein [Methylococcaceae bacterium]|nr:rhodanese-like domain-containing protein [Methylococcaceae bacterium]
MRKLIMVLNICLLLAGVTLAAAAVARNIAPADALSLVKARPNLYLLDVRTPQEFQQARIAGAHLIPIDQFMQRVGELPQDRPILVYCAVGSRSAQVFSFLARRGYTEVYNLDGGIYAWAAKGYPVER